MQSCGSANVGRVSPSHFGSFPDSWHLGSSFVALTVVVGVVGFVVIIVVATVDAFVIVLVVGVLVVAVVDGTVLSVVDDKSAISVGGAH